MRPGINVGKRTKPIHVVGMGRVWLHFEPSLFRLPLSLRAMKGLRMNSSGNHDPLILKLESITDLSDEERQALRALPLTIKTFGPDHDIVREGDRPSECCLIIEGFVCRYKLTEEGKRQIMSFHIPGDIPDLQSLHLSLMDHSLGTLVP